MSRPKKIKPLEDYKTDEQVVTRGTAVAAAIAGNPNFPTPPVDPVALKKGVDSLSALMAQSHDGSKRVIAEKNKQKEAVIGMLHLMGRYVQVTCKNDMAIFLTSGFVPQSTAKAQPQPLSHAIRKIEHGPVSGQLLLQLKSHPGASSYEYRYGVVGPNGAPPTTWTNQPATVVKAPIVIKGLTPMTMYAFQARALTKIGFTDWSDSVTFICT